MTETELRKKAIAHAHNYFGYPTTGFALWCAPRVKYSKTQDIFGVFDIIILSATNNITIYLQFTTIQHMAERRSKIHNWLSINKFYEFPCWLWGYNSKTDVWKHEIISINDPNKKQFPDLV